MRLADPLVPDSNQCIIKGMMPNEQGNESSVRQDDVRSDAGSASRDRERELKQPHWLLKFITAVLAPLGVPWAKKIQEEAAHLKREAEEGALQAGRKKVAEVSGRGPKQP